MDYVELSVRVPKSLIDFLSAYLKFCGIQESAKDHMKRELEWHAKVFTKNLIVVNVENSEAIIEHYGLGKVLKDVPDESLEI